jgi:hypothetical protein
MSTYGTMRLAAQIYDLREAGFTINSVEKTAEDGQKYTRYYYVDAPSKERESAGFSHKEPCPKCGSKDNLGRIPRWLRFVLRHGLWALGASDRWHLRAKGARISTPKEFKTGIYADLEDRGLTRETLEKWGYQVNVDEKCHIANYRDAKGELVAQKLRYAGKKFKCLNGSKDMPLYGMWRAQGDLSVVIVEGEMDALSVSAGVQAQVRRRLAAERLEGRGLQLPALLRVAGRLQEDRPDVRSRRAWALGD